MRRTLVSAVSAALLFLPLAAGAVPADKDSWVKAVEKRLDQVLEGPVGFSPPGTRVGEVRMHVDAQGNSSNYELIRSTGQPANDEVVMDAAKDMGRLPAPPASVVGHPVVVRVSFITPTQIEERYGKPELKPTVIVEDATFEPQR